MDNNRHHIDMLFSQEQTLLAAERTFSAWLRTALAAMAGGLAILRLIIFKTEEHRMLGHLAGLLLILWGCLLIVLASMDYKAMQNKLTASQNYKNSQAGYFFIVLPLLVICALLIWITLP